MTAHVEGILFDIGGTLRSLAQPNEAERRRKIRQIMELVQADGSFAFFADLLSSRGNAYAQWARQTQRELSEPELWSRWMLPDRPASQIRKISIQLNQLWREAAGARPMFPETREVTLELFRRGYQLGIVSNTVSSMEVPRALRELRISGLFEAVVLSCEVGIRKPNPAILQVAATRMGLEPAKCAYVGDRPECDLPAARGAGFSSAVIIGNPDGPSVGGAGSGGEPANHGIQNLNELLDIFPPREETQVPSSAHDASFSTMWAMQNFPELADFMEMSRRLGFRRIELNHQIDSRMLEGLDLSRYAFSSVHEPCPADVSTSELKDKDWLISSPDEDRRAKGMEAIQRSIQFAHALGLHTIVVHCGMVSNDMSLEQELQALHESGLTAGSRFAKIQRMLRHTRRDLISSHLDAVKTSLDQLLEYASQFDMRLGLENRYHYFDIPSLDEMGGLLEMADASRLGFVYDVGHAQHLDQLGFYPHEDWLRRYSTRMIEAHLHDVKGMKDHLAPGLGEVDFDMVAAYLPEGAIRTLELEHSNTPEQVKAGLTHLLMHKCLRMIRET